MKIFDEKFLGISPPPLEKYPIVFPKPESVNVNINLKKNKNETPSSLPLNNPTLNENKRSNVTNNTKMPNMSKGYVSLFQNKKIIYPILMLIIKCLVKTGLMLSIIIII